VQESYPIFAHFSTRGRGHIFVSALSVVPDFCAVCIVALHPLAPPPHALSLPHAEQPRATQTAAGSRSLAD
jgi:hypothetical protein